MSKTESGVKIHMGKKHKQKIELAPLDVKNVYYEHLEITRKVTKPECLAIVRKYDKIKTSLQNF